MTIDGNFDFKKYDIGGNNANANDGRLTGEEVKKAEADGWTVWDGCKDGDKIEQKHYRGSDKISKLRAAIQYYMNMWTSNSYKEFDKLKNEILEQKLIKAGIKFCKMNGELIPKTDDVLFNPQYKKLEQEAEAEAKKQLGLSDAAFNFNGTSTQKTSNTETQETEKTKTQATENIQIDKSIALLYIPDPNDETSKILEKLEKFGL